MSSFFRQQLEDWLKTIDVKADRVLDVGGAQLPIKGRTNSWEAQEYKILDIEQPHGGSKPDIVADLEEDEVVGINEYFDVAFCLEVMEYLINPSYFLQNLSDLIQQGGTLYVSFPFIYPQHAPEGKDYLRYTRAGACKLLKDAGFTDIEVTPRYAQQSLSPLWAFEKMHPLKGYDGHDEIGYMIKCRKS